ncbi:TPA: AAA family ATPase [Klebsiella variicola subsp. variicola]
MSKIETIFIKNMWGYKTVNLNLSSSINFLIGMNGSGKTTIINILTNSLKVELHPLLKIRFDFIKILFSNGESFYLSKASSNSVEIIINRAGAEYQYVIENDEYDFEMDRRIDEARLIIDKISEVDFLPLSRTINKEFGDDHFYDKPVDNVNHKLESIRNDLVSSFSKSQAVYSRIASNFQRDVFEKLLELPSEHDINEFVFSGGYENDEAALRELSDFITPSDEASRAERLARYLTELSSAFDALGSSSKRISVSEIGLIYSAWRTKSLISDYEKIKNKKNSIFKSQNDFFDVFKMFFNKDKIFSLTAKNELIMKVPSGNLDLVELSSGEKQMIILLGQMYISNRKPVIYIADEPEVSLHVKWQEKLVDALLIINPKAQFLLATHSPDIIGRRKDFALKV